ncbi:MAG: S8 family serine peptidase, partial [Nanoarchaeota archaeon]
VAPGAKIYALKVSVSSRHTFTDTILRAVDWSVDPNQDGGFSDHLDIISMSAGMPCVYFGGYSGICGPNDILSNAFDNSVQVGVVAVTSAGNSGESAMTIGSPMSKEIIVVGNSDKNDFLAQSSSKGPIFGESFGIVKPDVTAHGVMICAAVPYSDDFNLCREGEYEYKSGTSMSTPHVSGLVALIKQAHPGWSPREIQHSLREGAIEHTVYISPNREGYGRIDALNSVFSEKPPISIVETGGIIVGQEEIIGTAMADSFDHYELYVSKGFFRSAIDLDLITESELSGFLQGETWKGSLEKALEMDDIYLDTFEFSEESNFSEFVPLINEWYLISISTNQKEDETIHLFDSISYENDLYYLKLIGYDIDGMSSEDMSMILVQNSNCGNGIIEFGEECDGIYFNGETCESLGHAGGILNCSAGCQLDVSECSQFVCNYGGSYNLDGTCSLEIMHNFLGSGSIRKTTNDVDDWDSVHDAGQGDAQNIFEVGVMRDQTLEIIKASRLFLSFDTSQLIDEMTISSTELVVFPISIESDDDDGNHYISAVESTQQSPLFLSGEDFNQCGTVDNPVLLSENLYLSEMALGEESKIVLNDEGLNFLNREGFTTFGVREGHDISDEVIDLDKTNTLWVDDMNDYNPAFLRVNYNALFECASVSFGIVSWWPGEGNAEDVVDENDGELKGGVGFAEGRAEQAFSFNSYDDYVEIPDADNLDVTSVTIEAWIKSNNFTGEGTVVLKDYSYGMFIDDYPEEDLFCYFETSAGLLEVAGSGEILLNLEAWNHVACTYDELTGEGNLYINGEIAGLSSIGQINVPILVDDEPLFIGGTPSPSTLYFDGLIDEVSLYNSVLSQNEIQRIYEASSAGKCQSSTCEPQYQCRSDGCGQDPVPEGDAWCEQEYGLEYQCCVRTSPLTCSELGGECMLPEDCDVILASGDECADEGYPRYYCCEEDKGRILREVPQREPVPERGGGGFIEKEKMALSPEGEGFWDWLKKFFE